MSEKRLIGKYIAEWVSKNEFAYVCPFCYSALRKDGNPKKHAHHLLHTHSNTKHTLENRVENKMSHCPNGDKHLNIDIEITDDTRRV